MKTLYLALAVVSLTACATIMHGTHQDIGVSSSPTGAKVLVDNMPQGATPVIAKLSRGDNHIVKIQMDGFAPAELLLTKSVSGWVWGNLLFGGLIGLAVDAITGGLYNLSPDQLQASLSKTGTQISSTKSGIYVVLAQRADPAWVKIGQLQRTTPLVAGH